MDRVTSLQIPELERWDSDANGLQCSQSSRKTIDVLLAGQKGHVAITTKLRPAVKHASLSAHQQVLDLVGRECRKDFENRIRGQEILPHADKSPIASSTLAIVARGIADTTPATTHRSLATASRFFSEGSSAGWGLVVRHRCTVKTDHVRFTRNRLTNHIFSTNIHQTITAPPSDLLDTTM